MNYFIIIMPPAFLFFNLEARRSHAGLKKYLPLHEFDIPPTIPGAEVLLHFPVGLFLTLEICSDIAGL